ncbi:GTP 3',8-cyclase MoaA [Helicobacter cynogastricus]|uniref:GTP 3',8-cyclase MoaA n=1 Tax=Helicobacter cynogastricus TaxID=329937 RepID=UPI000CF0D5F5|nr:GTP 3',8-cyclase MoaA [Helicobacter cynogastricus]
MLIDGFGRQVTYLRVSLTKQCNFRCAYCMPTTPLDFNPREEVIPLDRMLEFLKIAIDAGIEKIRLTGGEPLLRKDLVPFIAKLHAYNPKVLLVLTTNAFLLEKHAQSLKNAGLSRVNISLDSLKAGRVLQISQKDALKAVLRGIEAALKAGLKLKFNMVVLKGINEGEILDLLDFAQEKNSQIRYIEFMENTHAHARLQGVSQAQILEVINTRYKIIGAPQKELGPAQIYTLENGYQFGIIAPHKEDFCKSCNRVRLSADGTLFPCLYYQDSVNAKEAILSAESARMLEVLKQAVANKPEKNLWSGSYQISERAFYQTGG